MELSKKKEVINACLKMFVSKGLSETTSRDLSKALNLQSGGLYYYFKSKDDAVIACAEEAAITVETELISPMLNELTDCDKMMRSLRARADKMAPVMKFLVQAATAERYKGKLRPILNTISARYKTYVDRFSNYFECDEAEIEPYVYICITAVSNYMIFGEVSYILPQIALVKKKIRELQMRKEENKNEN